jgi:hypothetical protein
LGIDLKNSGYYALGHYACEQLRDFGKAPYNGDNGDYGNRAHIDQFMVHRIPKWSEEADSSILSPASMEHPPTLKCIACDAISGPCVAFPDLLCSDPHNNFFVMKPSHTWSQLFEDEAHKI